MTELEYKEQSERLEKYKKAEDKISVISRKKSEISNGILSIRCAQNKEVNFNYLGDDFKERLLGNILSFLDSEIESIKKSMEDI